MSVGSTVTWLFTFLVTLCFPLVKDALTPSGATKVQTQNAVSYLMWFFAAMCAGSFLWIWRYIFETKGRTLEDIQLLLKGEDPAAQRTGGEAELGTGGFKRV